MWQDPHYLRWEPTEEGHAVKGNGWQMIRALGKVFGPPPWEFTAPDSLMQLEAMAAASVSDTKMYTELIDALHEHGSIRVWSPQWDEQQRIQGAAWVHGE